MERIKPMDKSIQEILEKNRYTIQYYQREYKWEYRQITELIQDLILSFMSNYSEGHTRQDVENYKNYFLGSIIITKNNEIVDGQQRITSILLFLIYLNNLLKSSNIEGIDVVSCIVVNKFGKKTFCIDVEERNSCLEDLYVHNEYIVKENDLESVINMRNRYDDITQNFSNELREENILPLFIEWLLYKVYFIEIQSESEKDAYEIFVTMNDRGLSLTPIDMLKGFLLSEIEDVKKRENANKLWKDKISKIKIYDKNADLDFIKDWLRSQYGDMTKGDIKDSDSEKIGKMFHRWVVENKDILNLNNSESFYNIITNNFSKYASIYIELRKYAKNFDKKYEYVYYNSHRNFTLQFVLILAAISPTDNEDVIYKKVKLVSCFIDQLISIRIFKSLTVAQNTFKHIIFKLINPIRHKSVEEISIILKEYLSTQEYTIDNCMDEYSNNHPSGRFIFHNLARITYFVESNCGKDISFDAYINRKVKNSYDIEHIWADKYIEHNHNTKFSIENDFKINRNMFGGLLLLPKDKNRSYQDMPYAEKVEHYNSENILARSLNKNCYTNNPSFLRFIKEQNLNFKSYELFDKTALDERTELYQDICKKIWNINLLDI